MKILMVLTSHDKLGDTGNKTGFWLEEFAAPYYVLRDAGAEITLASPKGGQPPLDPSSDSEDAQTDATKRFKLDKAAQQDLASTQVLASVDADGFADLFGIHRADAMDIGQCDGDTFPRRNVDASNTSHALSFSSCGSVAPEPFFTTQGPKAKPSGRSMVHPVAG